MSVSDHSIRDISWDLISFSQRMMFDLFESITYLRHSINVVVIAKDSERLAMTFFCFKLEEKLFKEPQLIQYSYQPYDNQKF